MHEVASEDKEAPVLTKNVPTATLGRSSESLGYHCGQNGYSHGFLVLIFFSFFGFITNIAHFHSIFPCTGPHTDGTKHDPLFPAGVCQDRRPLGGGSPPWRRLFVETLAFGGSTLSSGPLITEAPAGRPGQPPSGTQRRRAQRGAQYQRLEDGPARQTAGEVRRVLTEFQKALHQAKGRSLKDDELAPISRSTRASLTSTTDDPCTDSLAASHCATMLNRF